MIAGDSRLTAVVLGLIVLGAVLMALSIFSPRRRPSATVSSAPAMPRNEPDRVSVALEQAAEPSEIVGLLEPDLIAPPHELPGPTAEPVAEPPTVAEAAPAVETLPVEPDLIAPPHEAPGPSAEPVAEPPAAVEAAPAAETLPVETIATAPLEPVGLPEYAALLEPAELRDAGAVAASAEPEPLQEPSAPVAPESVPLPEIASVGEAPESAAAWVSRIDPGAGPIDRDTRAGLIARLGFVGDTWAIDILAAAYLEETEPRLRDALVAALASSRSPESREALRAALRSERASERSLAVDALADVGEFDALVPLLGDASLPVAIAVLHALHRNGALGAIEAFLDADPQSDRTRELETVLSILRPRRR